MQYITLMSRYDKCQKIHKTLVNTIYSQYCSHSIFPLANMYDNMYRLAAVPFGFNFPSLPREFGYDNNYLIKYSILRVNLHSKIVTNDENTK